MKKFFLFLLIFSVIGFSFTFAQSNTPKPILKLGANCYYSSNNAVTTTVYWVADGTSDPLPNSFFIYYANEKSYDLSTYSKIGEIKAEANSSGYYTFKTTLSTIKNTGYFAVTAVALTNSNTILESTPVITPAYFGNDNNYITFSSQPVCTAKLNAEYTYYPKVTTSYSSAIKYELYGDTKEKVVLDENTGRFSWTPTTVGTFTFGIKAYLADDKNISNVQKWTVKVTDPNAPYIKIVSTPAIYATPNKEYVYQVLTETNIKCPSAFEFEGNLPKNASFDKTTGTLRWTPQQYEVLSGTIKAYLTCDQNTVDYQQFAIKGYSSNDDIVYCSFIKGTIVLENGQLATDGKVIAWRISPDSKINPQFSGAVVNGAFQIKIPEGNYVIEYDGTNFEHGWYENAATFDLAKRFTIKCNESLELRIAAKSKVQPKYFNVSGKVLDQSNNPVYSYIEFIPITSSGTYNKNSTQFMTKTDSEGKYTISLPNNMDFKAHAVPTSNQNLADQYYNQVSSLFEADIIVIEKDIENINFILKATDVKSAGFSGKVINSDGAAIQATVYATQINSNSTKNYKQYAVDTDTEGYYKFSKLPYGTYVLMSVPKSKNYVPGYYVINDVVTQKWTDATKIQVQEVMTDMIYTIKHRERLAVKGIIQLNGMVSKLNSILIKTDKPQAETSPLAGALVYVIDQAGDIVDYTFSDVNGQFNMDQLGQGTATLFVNAPGYIETSMPLQLDYQKNFKVSNLNVALNSADVSDVTETTNSNFKLYPSIAKETVKVEFESESGLAIINVYDLNGNLVLNTSATTISGLNSLTINLKGLSDGNYYLKLNANDKQYFSIIKIMK